MGIACDADRSVSCELHVASHSLALVEVDRVSEVERLHAERQRPVRDLQHQVVVGPHQAEPDACPIESSCYTREFAQEHRSGEIVAKQGRRGPDAMSEDMK